MEVLYFFFVDCSSGWVDLGLDRGDAYPGTKGMGGRSSTSIMQDKKCWTPFPGPVRNRFLSSLWWFMVVQPIILGSYTLRSGTYTIVD